MPTYMLTKVAYKLNVQKTVIKIYHEFSGMPLPKKWNFQGQKQVFY